MVSILKGCFLDVAVIVKLFFVLSNPLRRWEDMNWPKKDDDKDKDKDKDRDHDKDI